MMKSLHFFVALTAALFLSHQVLAQGLLNEVLGGGNGQGNVNNPQPRGNLQGAVQNAIEGAVRGAVDGVQRGVQTIPTVPGQENSLVPNPGTMIPGASSNAVGSLGSNSLSGSTNASVATGGAGNVPFNNAGVNWQQMLQQVITGNNGALRIGAESNNELRAMGLQPNDEIVDAGGRAYMSRTDFETALRSGQTVYVRRNGQIIAVSQAKNSQLDNRSLGWNLSNINNRLILASIISNGLASRIGLRAGDQLVRVNGQAVYSQSDFDRIHQSSNGPWTIVYLRDGREYEVVLPVENSGSVAIPKNIDMNAVRSKLDQIEQLTRELRRDLGL
jgi:membrane-associated protease RseP (regulator of RpoE activity)